jgi:hypothetical protein
MTTDLHHDGAPAAAGILPAAPGALVGRQVRRASRGALRYTPWAQIVMTVPSRDGLCWLVAFIDGDVDVWRVDDTHAHYEFDPQ